MDPLAHTLVGAALGRAVAGRDVPAAGWIGAIAANAPDWSELVLKPDLWPPRAGGEYLVFHRGITHSFVGAAVEAAVLTGLVGVLLRLWARRAMVPAPLWRWVATCVTATVASHLYLDWQGSYGLRPFLPWSAQWYYGDWVAIVDPLLLGSAARGARLGRPAPLGTGARVPRHAPWRHDAGVVGRPRPRRVVGAAGAGGVRGGRRGGLDPALVRSGGPTPGGGVWAGGARRVRRRERRGEPRGQGADSRRRVTAVRPRRPLGAAHHRGATLPLGSALRFAGQRRRRRVGRRSAPRPPRRARGAHHPAGSGHRAIRAVPCGGGGFEQRRCPRIAVGRAVPRTRVGRRRLGDGAGPAPLTRLDWAANEPRNPSCRPAGRRRPGPDAGVPSGPARGRHPRVRRRRNRVRAVPSSRRKYEPEVRASPGATCTAWPPSSTTS